VDFLQGILMDAIFTISSVFLPLIRPSATFSQKTQGEPVPERSDGRME
jgi:hypothetical protein